MKTDVLVEIQIAVNLILTAVEVDYQNVEVHPILLDRVYDI